MKGHSPDVGNVGLTGSGVTAVATTASGVAGWLNEYAMVIGLSISVISLIIGVVFKMLSYIRSERHHRERMEAEAKQNAQALEALREEVRSQLSEQRLN